MQPKRTTLALRPPPKNADAFVSGDARPSTPDVERLDAEVANAERPSPELVREPSPGADVSASSPQPLASNAQRSGPSVEAPTPDAQGSAPGVQRPALDVEPSVPEVQRPTSSAGRSEISSRPRRSTPDVERLVPDAAAPVVSVERSAPTPILNAERSASVPSFSRGSKAVIERKKGAMRRTSVYLQMSTAAALAEYCSASDREMSSVVDEAVRQFLARGR